MLYEWHIDHKKSVYIQTKRLKLFENNQIITASRTITLTHEINVIGPSMFPYRPKYGEIWERKT